MAEPLGKLARQLLTHVERLPYSEMHTKIFQQPAFPQLAKSVFSAKAVEVDAAVAQLRGHAATLRLSNPERSRIGMLLNAVEQARLIRPEDREPYIHLKAETQPVEPKTERRVLPSVIGTRKPASEKAPAQPVEKAEKAELPAEKKDLLQQTGFGHLAGSDYIHGWGVEELKWMADTVKANGLAPSDVTPSHLNLSRKEFAKVMERTAAQRKLIADLEKPEAGRQEKNRRLLEKAGFGRIAEKKPAVLEYDPIFLESRILFLRRLGARKVVQPEHFSPRVPWKRLERTLMRTPIGMKRAIQIAREHGISPSGVKPVLAKLSEGVFSQRMAALAERKAKRLEKSDRELESGGRLEAVREAKRRLLEESGFGHVVSSGFLGIAGVEKFKRRIATAKEMGVNPADVNPTYFGYGDEKFAEALKLIKQEEAKKKQGGT